MYAQRPPIKLIGEEYVVRLERVGVVMAWTASDAIKEGRREFGVNWPMVQREDA